LDASKLKQVGDAEFTSGNPGMFGVGGILTLTFKTVKAGVTTLMLVYCRHWETNVKPLGKFKAKLIINYPCCF
jgi:predicted secreted protein